MSNPFVLTLKLKQHTPIIHFQAEQAGATLRATEVKSKLDKFIVERFLSLDNKFLKHEDAVNKLNKAINSKHSLYKIHFDCPNKVGFYLPLAMKMDSKSYPNKHKNIQDYIQRNKNINVSILAPTPYFANQDKIEFVPRSDVIKSIDFVELRLGIYTSQPITGNIMVGDKDVYDLLSEVIPYFFVYENFGTRQNKGFGSFSITYINDIEFTHTESVLQKICSYKSKKTKDILQAFAFIQETHQLLKSGKNYQGYEKSKLFEYFIKDHTPPIRWEKRYLKQRINSNKISGKNLFFKVKNSPIDIENVSKKCYNDWKDSQKNEYKFVRALLGLAEQYEFLVSGNDGHSDNRIKYVVTMKHTEPINQKKIERFKSPIVFKVIEQQVYIRFDQSYQQILGKEFEFTLKLKGGENVTTKPLGSLKIPASFDMATFLKQYLSKSDWELL